MASSAVYLVLLVMVTGSEATVEYRVQIWTPPYLLNGLPRPNIVSAPELIAPGSRFPIQWSGVDTIDRVVLSKMPGVTHSHPHGCSPVGACMHCSGSRDQCRHHHMQRAPGLHCRHPRAVPALHPAQRRALCRAGKQPGRPIPHSVQAWPWMLDHHQFVRKCSIKIERCAPGVIFWMQLEPRSTLKCQQGREALVQPCLINLKPMS